MANLIVNSKVDYYWVVAPLAANAEYSAIDTATTDLLEIKDLIENGDIVATPNYDTWLPTGGKIRQQEIVSLDYANIELNMLYDTEQAFQMAVETASTTRPLKGVKGTLVSKVLADPTDEDSKNVFHVMPGFLAGYTKSFESELVSRFITTFTFTDDPRTVSE